MRANWQARVLLASDRIVELNVFDLSESGIGLISEVGIPAHSVLPIALAVPGPERSAQDHAGVRHDQDHAHDRARPLHPLRRHLGADPDGVARPDQPMGAAAAQVSPSPTRTSSTPPREGALAREQPSAMRASQRCHDSGMTEQEPWITWEESGAPQRARWRSESQAMPATLLPVDDTLPANAAFKLINEGTGLLWRGDFHNGRQLLQALGRRVDKPPRADGRARAPRPRARTRPRARATRSRATARRRRAAPRCSAACWCSSSPTTRSRCAARPTSAPRWPRPGARPTARRPSPRCASCRA